MKTTLTLIKHAALLLLLSTLTPQLSTWAQGTAFTYQGRLNDGANLANGSYDLRFIIYDNSVGGSQLGPILTNYATTVSSGLFIATLDFGANFPGPARWLEIAVRTNGGGGFATLSPRQPLTPSPYAIMAGDVSGANIARLNVPNTATTATGVPIITSGFITSATVTSGGSGYTTAPLVTVTDTTGSGASVTATVSNGAVVNLTVQSPGHSYSLNATFITIGAPPSNAYQVFSGTSYFTGLNTFSNPSNTFAGGFTGNGAGLTNLNDLNAWQLSGNLGTSPGLNFLGTRDNQPLELKVDGRRALRLEPTANDANHSNIVNVVGGSPANFVAPGVYGATIAGGGGQSSFGSSTNSISSDFGGIGGGLLKTQTNNTTAH